jgi:hypothetical protein
MNRQLAGLARYRYKRMLIVGLVVSGCGGSAASGGGFDQYKKNLKLGFAKQIACPESDVTMQEQPETGLYKVVGCQRVYECSPSTCVESKESQQRTTQKMMIAQLSLETGCKKTQIKVENSGNVGKRVVFRLAACKKAYLCSVQGGKVSCKAALGQVAPATSPAPKKK